MANCLNSRYSYYLLAIIVGHGAISRRYYVEQTASKL